MFNRISSLTLAILLFLVLLGSTANLYVFLVSLFVLAVGTLIINVKRIGWSWPLLSLPTFFLLASGSAFAVITSPTLRIIFLIISSLLFLLLELNLGHESHLLQNLYLLSVFGIFLGIFALDFYFHLNIFLAVLLIFLFSYILIAQGFAGFSLPTKKYFSFITALICAQVGWGLLLWPTYFFVNTVVLFSVYYLLWLFSFSVFFGKLNKVKIYWQLALIMFVLAVTLGSASWRPLI